jgi:hypothetical protein
MGLDMYLTNERTGKELYWRKANAIHGYFVESCVLRSDEDIDEVGIYLVFKEHLVELRSQCKEVLEALKKNNKKKALELLPPREGFFFGSYEIDEWYEKDLKLTIQQIDDALKEHQEGDVWHYYASW